MVGIRGIDGTQGRLNWDTCRVSLFCLVHWSGVEGCDFVCMVFLPSFLLLDNTLGKFSRGCCASGDACSPSFSPRGFYFRKVEKDEREEGKRPTSKYVSGKE